MMILVVGGPNSGKSLRAEELAVEMSAEDKRIYLAAMIPYGEEGAARIKRHRELRKGKGFVTVERAKDIGALADEDGCIGGIRAREATVLLECAANLCANVMFGDRRGDVSGTSEESVFKYVTDDILKLRDKVKNLIVVSDEFEPEDDFDKDTLGYIRVMSRINRELSDKADRTYDITEGSWKVK